MQIQTTKGQWSCVVYSSLNGLSQTSSPRGLPQSFRDHTPSFRETLRMKLASAGFRGKKKFKIASATTTLASAKHVRIELVEFKVRYEWMIYISKCRHWPIPWVRNLHLPRGFRGASANFLQQNHVGTHRHISTSNNVFAKHAPTPAYLSIKPSQRTPIRYK